MTDDNRRTQAQAVFFSLVMVLSMVGGTVALAGSATADIQDVNGLTATDVTPGTDQVTQTVTIENVENSNNTDTINITNDGDLDDSVINKSATSVTSSNGHSASVDSVEPDGTIVVGLTENSAATDDIVIEVGHNLSDVSSLPELPTEVTYTATSGVDDISVTDTFTVTEKQPEFNNGNATVPASSPNTIDIKFDEPVAVESDPASAFSFNNVTDATGSELSINDATASSQTLTLELDGYVASNASSLEVSYETDSGEIVHAGNADVTALNSTDKEVTNGAQPGLVDAEVTDTNPDRLVMNFSEPLDSGSNTEIADGFSLEGFDVNDVYENTSQGPDDQVILNLSKSVAPGANLTGLSYNGPDSALNSSLDGSDEPLYNFSDKTVTNKVAPKLQSAEVTNTNKSIIVATYQDGAEVVLNKSSNFEGGTGTTLTIADSSDTSFGGVDVASNEIALKNDTAFAAADGSSLNLNDSGGAVESTAGVSSATKEDVGITNNVTPTFASARVTNAIPDQVEVTFSESVQANVSDGNINSSVTDAFAFVVNVGDDDEEELRVRNVSSISGDTVTLNLGQPDGTPETVSVGDDLTDALSYEPTAPSDGNEEYPLNASSGTNANVGSFTDEDVTNEIGADLSVAEVTATADQLRVTFTEDIERSGTSSEVENAFDVNDNSTVDVTSSFNGIENKDTVVFNNSTGDGFVANADAYNSSLDLTSALNYTPSDADADNPLVIAATGDNVGSFSNEDIQNNIQPRIESAEVTNSDPVNVNVTYTEDISDSDTNAYEAFTLTGTDAPDITGQSTAGNTLTLELGGTVANGDTLGDLEYTGGTPDQEIISGETGSDAVGIDGDLATVDNLVGSAPVLQSVTVDDAPENNDDDAEGELVLNFGTDVNVGTTDASGLTFNSGNPDIGVSINKLNLSESTGKKVVANFTSDSGSVDSNIQQGDDLSGASLTVEDASAVAITSNDGDNNNITEATVDDVSNEIAGEVDTVGTIQIDDDLVSTTARGDTTRDLNVTVENLEDTDGNPVKDASSVSAVSIQNESGEVTTLSVTDIDRFDSTTVTVESESGTSGSFNSSVGEDITANLAGAESNSATVVHEAFSTSSTGYFLHSQPMPGTLVLGDESKFDDISYYNSESANYDSYTDGSDVDQVHNALFIESLDNGAAYGYAYDENRNVSTINVGSVDMGEGWHIVGSNYDVSGDSTITLNEDLSLENDINGTSVSVQDKSLPGTTRSGDYDVNNNEAYYVFLQQEDTRPIVLPEYDPDD